MTAIHRRAMLRAMLGGGAVLTLGLATLIPDPAESAPLTMAAGRPVETESPFEKAVWVRRRRRRVRVRVCWWRRGRRVCRWRWRWVWR
jgi:hypothetical protein